MNGLKIDQRGLSRKVQILVLLVPTETAVGFENAEIYTRQQLEVDHCLRETTRCSVAMPLLIIHIKSHLLVNQSSPHESIEEDEQLTRVNLLL